MADEEKTVPAWAITLMNTVAELKGSSTANMQAMNHELSRLNSELVRQASDTERKHLENLSRTSQAIEEIDAVKDKITVKIEESNKEIKKELDAHAILDSSRFQQVGDKVNKIFNWIGAGVVVVGIIWAVFTFAFPYWAKWKGLN